MDSFLGPKQIVLPQEVVTKLYEQGATVVGLYSLIAKHCSFRGRSRITRSDILADSKLEPEDAQAALDWLWREGLLEYHQIISPDGEITDEFFYLVSQDRTIKKSGGD